MQNRSHCPTDWRQKIEGFISRFCLLDLRNWSVLKNFAFGNFILEPFDKEKMVMHNVNSWENPFMFKKPVHTRFTCKSKSLQARGFQSSPIITKVDWKTMAYKNRCKVTGFSIYNVNAFIETNSNSVNNMSSASNKINLDLNLNINIFPSSTRNFLFVIQTP